MRRYILFILSLPVGTSYFLYHLRILLVIHLSISHLPFTNIICISCLLCVLPSVHQLSILCHIYMSIDTIYLFFHLFFLPSTHPSLHSCIIALYVWPSIHPSTNLQMNTPIVTHNTHTHARPCDSPEYAEREDFQVKGTLV